jgi:exonuclease VII large subunit
MRARLARSTAAVTAKARSLNHLNPRRILKRGYSITTVKGATRPLKDPRDARTGQTLITRLAEGELRSLVTDRPSRQRRSAPTSTQSQPSLFDDTPAEAGD